MNLPSVTLVNVEALHFNEAARVLNHCQKEITFGDVVLLSPNSPPSVELKGRWVKTRELSYKDVSFFLIRELLNNVRTEFVLSVQNDGFIIHPQNWRNHWLAFDWIATPWKPEFPCKGRVGGGGFTMRSARLIALCVEYGHLYPCNVPEPHWGDDYWISETMRAEFERRGIRYAPLEAAAEFGLEYEIPEVPYTDDGCLGFHKFTTPQREAYRAILTT